MEATRQQVTVPTGVHCTDWRSHAESVRTVNARAKIPPGYLKLRSPGCWTEGRNSNPTKPATFRSTVLCPLLITLKKYYVHNAVGQWFRKVLYFYFDHTSEFIEIVAHTYTENDVTLRSPPTLQDLKMRETVN